MNINRPYTIKPPNMSPARQPLRNISNRMIAHKNNLYPPFNKTEKLRLSSGRKSLGNYEETCINHQLKPARFKVVSDEADLFYCEKCAILLASQGFKVMRTSNSSLRCLKMNPLLDHSKQFMEQIASFLQISENRLEGLMQDKLEKENYFESLLSDVDAQQEEYHKRVTAAMNLQRRAIQEMSEQYCRQHRVLVENLKKRRKEIQTVSEDIQCNMEIIAYLSEDQYYPIMNHYQEILNSSKEFLQSSGDIAIAQTNFVKPNCVCTYDEDKSVVKQGQKGIESFSFDAKMDPCWDKSQRLRVSQLQLSATSDDNEEGFNQLQTPHL